MKKDLSSIDIILRREIEARIAEPLIRAFMEELGEERTLAVVRRAIREQALESAAQRAKAAKGNSIRHFVESGKAWSAGDALQREVLKLDDKTYHYNIVRCRYAEMYKELGMADLGYVLSCGRDFDMVEGFNPRMKLERTKTIMQGGEYCDFRISLMER